MPIHLADSKVLPTALFDLARGNGTLAALRPASRAWYEQAERQLTWLREAWTAAEAPKAALALLGVDGPLADAARERGIALAAEDLAAYREKLARDRGFFGDCVVEVDPLSMQPVVPQGG
jgi:hypothetical protein